MLRVILLLIPFISIVLLKRCFLAFLITCLLLCLSASFPLCFRLGLLDFASLDFALDARGFALGLVAAVDADLFFGRPLLGAGSLSICLACSAGEMLGSFLTAAGVGKVATDLSSGAVAAAAASVSSLFAADVVLAGASLWSTLACAFMAVLLLPVASLWSALFSIAFLGHGLGAANCFQYCLYFLVSCSLASVLAVSASFAALGTNVFSSPVTSPLPLPPLPPLPPCPLTTSLLSPSVALVWPSSRKRLAGTLTVAWITREHACMHTYGIQWACPHRSIYIYTLYKYLACISALMVISSAPIGRVSKVSTPQRRDPIIPH